VVFLFVKKLQKWVYKLKIKIWTIPIQVISMETNGKNSQIPCFGKICGKLALFQKYLAIYHFFNTRVPQNRVLNSTWVHWTRVSSESPEWHCWPGICVIKKNNVVLNITEIEYFFIVLELHTVEYLFSFSFFFPLFLLLIQSSSSLPLCLT